MSRTIYRDNVIKSLAEAMRSHAMAYALIEGKS